MEDEKPKRKQAKKKGRVVRLTPDLVTIVAEQQQPGETVHEVIRRLLGLTGDIRYVLPSDLHESVEDARGRAIIKAVRSKVKRTERPVAVRIRP